MTIHKLLPFCVLSLYKMQVGQDLGGVLTAVSGGDVHRHLGH